MSKTTERLDLRLSHEDKERLRLAAELLDEPLAVFVRRVALAQAERVIAHPPNQDRGSLSERLRGRATIPLSTDDIMRLTRGT